MMLKLLGNEPWNWYNVELYKFGFQLISFIEPQIENRAHSARAV